MKKNTIVAATVAALSLTAEVLTRPFRPDTVNSLVAQTERQVDRLIAVAAREVDKAVKVDDKANAELSKAQSRYFKDRAKADAHRNEAIAATRIANRFANLIR